MATSGHPSGDSITLLSRCLVVPSPGQVSRMSLRLTFFDMVWLYSPPVQRLIFYEIPHITKTSFLEEVIPKLKDSLTLTLDNYLPLAGNLVIPANSDSSSPEILYRQGNSVAMIVSESNTIGFSDLVSNHARNCSEFHPLVQGLTQSVNDSGSTVTNVLALQVTLFPSKGLSIGISNHPAAGDGSTIFRFMCIWALYAKVGGEEATKKLNKITTGILPFYYRTIVKDPKGLSSIIWNQWSDIIKLDPGSGISSNTNKVRQTFFISAQDVQRLKNLVSKLPQTPIRMTSFNVVCAYVWISLVKSLGEEVSDVEEYENFVCFGHCRNRFDPMVTENWFGNCLTVSPANGRKGELVGERGFPLAVGLIGAAMNEKLYSKDAILVGAEKWLMCLDNINLNRTVVVAGSPRFNYYLLDFGMGKPIKFEFVSIDKTSSISLCGGRQCKKDIEVGLSLPKHRMDVFAAIFNEGLKAL